MLFDLLKKKQKKEARPMYLYTEQELAEYEAYIEKSLGHYDHVFHEIASPDIHLDVIIVPPAEGQPYYKLVTMGAGAYRMNVPEKLRDYELEYAEYVIFLPADWKLDSPDENDYWPIRDLKNIGRLALYTDSWLAYGHTVQANEDGSPYAANTGFNSTMLVSVPAADGQRLELTLSSGKKINFYLLLPIYPEELAYKQAHDADALLDLMAGIPDLPVLNIRRQNAAG